MPLSYFSSSLKFIFLKEAYADEQVVLIENEFGEIGIDGGFLKEAGIQIREMNSGCICCSLVGDFGTSLKEVVDKYHPDRILIEPSGVGKLSDVIGFTGSMKAGKYVGRAVGSAISAVDAYVSARKAGTNVAGSCLAAGVAFSATYAAASISAGTGDDHTAGIMSDMTFGFSGVLYLSPVCM